MSSDVLDGTTPAPPTEPKPFFSRPAGKIFVIWFVMTVVGVVISLIAPHHLMPSMISEQGNTAVKTVIVFSVLAAPVAALVYAVATYSLLAWRRGSQETPPEDGPPLRGNTPLTIVWLIVSSFLCIVLLVWGLAELSAEAATHPGALQVDVTGQQWLWTYSYPGTGVQSRTLVLPLDRPVQFNVTSEDVTHGFWSMALGVQVDANPHVVTTLQATPNRLGSFTVRCSQVCGIYHAFMYSPGEVVTTAQFAAWLQSQGASAVSATRVSRAGS